MEARGLRKRLGPNVAVQGNLDPLTLFAPPEVIYAGVKDVRCTLFPTV